MTLKFGLGMDEKFSHGDFGFRFHSSGSATALRTKRERAMPLHELRALATEDIVQKVLDFDQTLDYLRTTADEIAGSDQSVKKRLQKINALVSEGVKSAKLLEERVLEAEAGYKMLRFGLASELKKELINIPAVASEKKRAALTPSDAGDVRKKRKTTSGTKKKKPRKKKAVNPRKASKIAEKKATAAAKRAASAVKKQIVKIEP
jgi:hypothetical protein